MARMQGRCTDGRDGGKLHLCTHCQAAEDAECFIDDRLDLGIKVVEEQSPWSAQTHRAVRVRRTRL